MGEMMPAVEALDLPFDREVVITTLGQEPHAFPNEAVIVMADAIEVRDPYGGLVMRERFIGKKPLPDGGWLFVGPEYDFTVAPGGENGGYDHYEGEEDGSD